MNYRILGVGFVVALVAAASAHAANVTEYTDAAAFNAATTNSTTLEFDAQGYEIPYPNSYTQDGVTFSQPAGRLFTFVNSIGSTPFAGDFLNNNGGAGGVTIQFQTPIYAFAMDFGYLENYGGAQSLTETFNFAGTSNDFSLRGPLIFSYNRPQFVGFVSDTPFSTIAIDDPTDGLAIGDFTFATQSALVPEPVSLAIFGTGLAGIAAIRRRGWIFSRLSLARR